jgi:predicted nucleotidyltransferase
MKEGADMDKVYSIDEIRMQLTPVFKSVPVYKAVLFGSYAKGNATADSDVDIVIDSKGELLNMAFYGVLEDVTQSLGKNVDLIEFSEIKKGTPIFYEIERQGVLLYDRKG